MTSSNAILDNKVLVSIITINLNNRTGLEKTLASLKEQQKDLFELIVIDGASTDGSISVVKQNLDIVSQWVSEPDNGIYDAMNKGIVKAQGKWINFLNSGDYYFQENTLTDLVNILSRKDLDVVYGDSYREESNGELFFKSSRDINDIWLGGLTRHNSMFARSDLLKNNPFQITSRMKVIADFDFMYKMQKQGRKFHHYDITPVLIYEADGLSDNRSSLQKYLDNYLIYRLHGSFSFTVHRYYLRQIIYAFLSKYKILGVYKKVRSSLRAKGLK